MNKKYILNKLINLLAKILLLKKPLKIHKDNCELKCISVRRKSVRSFIMNALCKKIYKCEPYSFQNTVFLRQKDFVVFDDFFPDNSTIVKIC